MPVSDAPEPENHRHGAVPEPLENRNHEDENENTEEDVVDEAHGFVRLC